MTAFLATLFSVANAPYTTALLAVALYVALQLVGLLPWGEHGDAGADADAHADLDAGADAHGDLDHEVGGEGAAGEAEGDSDGATADVQGPGLLGALSSALGVGRVPLAVVWQTVFTMFGLAGITGTTLLSSFTGGVSAFHLAFTVPFALVTGIALSAAVVRGIARLVPPSSGEASRRSDLVGCLGVVISSRVSDEFGEIRLADPEGRTLHVICRTRAGEPELPEGTEVMVVDRDREKDHLFVAALTKFLEDQNR